MSSTERSAWTGGIHLPQFDSLSADEEADVAIIGGGLTGLVAAYLLSAVNYSVVVLEKDRLGSGATAVTTAFLTQYIDTALVDLRRMLGREKARAIVDSHRQAIDMVERIVRHEKIECSWERTTNYMYADVPGQVKALEAEQAAAGELGLPLEVYTGHFPWPTARIVALPQQAKFHPLQYLAQLVGILKARGVRIYENTEAVKLEATKLETKKIVMSRGHDITAKYVVVATYAPFNKKLFFRKAFYTSYVVEAQIPKGFLPEAMYEDMANPYHYFRVDEQAGHDRLILGGADHRSDVPVKAEKSWRRLEEQVKTMLGSAPYTIVRRWKGPILESVDGLPFIGAVDDERVLYATGFSGNGMTYAHIAAQLLVDTIQGRPNPWHDLYDARRRPALKSLLYKGRDYTRKFFGGAVATTLLVR